MKPIFMGKAGLLATKYCLNVFGVFQLAAGSYIEVVTGGKFA
jgi:hypothetical protein